MNKLTKIISIFGLLLVGRVTGAPGLSSTAYDLMNFPRLARPSRAELFISGKQLRINTGCDDLLRKQIERQTALKWYVVPSQVEAVIPFKSLGIQQCFNPRLRYEQHHFSNDRDVNAVTGTAELEIWQAAINWFVCREQYMWGAGLKYQQNRGSSEFNIVQYPTSDDPVLNRYFLQWLEPTFGRQIQGKMKDSGVELTLWGAFPLKTEQRLQIALSTDWDWHELQAAYVNSTDHPELQGRRRIGWPLKSRETILTLCVQNLPGRIQAVEGGLFVNRLELEIDNHFSGTTDFSSLGRGDGQRQGIFLEAKAPTEHLELVAGLAGARYTGHLTVNTPVLGFVYYILPISHAAEGCLEQSTSFSQRIKADFFFQGRELNHQFALAWTHARYWLRMEGEAHLEFGLISTPLSAPVIWDVFLVDLSYRVSYSIRRIELAYQIKQLIPRTKRLDESRVSLQEPHPGLDIRYQGGRRHQLIINYRLGGN